MSSLRRSFRTTDLSFQNNLHQHLRIGKLYELPLHKKHITQGIREKLSRVYTHTHAHTHTHTTDTHTRTTHAHTRAHACTHTHARISGNLRVAEQEKTEKVQTMRISLNSRDTVRSKRQFTAKNIVERKGDYEHLTISFEHLELII